MADDCGDAGVVANDSSDSFLEILEGHYRGNRV